MSGWLASAMRYLASPRITLAVGLLNLGIVFLVVAGGGPLPRLQAFVGATGVLWFMAWWAMRRRGAPIGVGPVPNVPRLMDIDPGPHLGNAEANARAERELREAIGDEAMAHLIDHGWVQVGDWAFRDSPMGGIAHRGGSTGGWQRYCVNTVDEGLPRYDRVRTLYEWALHDPDRLLREANSQGRRVPDVEVALGVGAPPGPQSLLDTPVLRPLPPTPIYVFIEPSVATPELVRAQVTRPAAHCAFERVEAMGYLRDAIHVRELRPDDLGLPAWRHDAVVWGHHIEPARAIAIYGFQVDLAEREQGLDEVEVSVELHYIPPLPLESLYLRPFGIGYLNSPLLVAGGEFARFSLTRAAGSMGRFFLRPIGYVAEVL